MEHLQLSFLSIFYIQFMCNYFGPFLSLAFYKKALYKYSKALIDLELLTLSTFVEQLMNEM